MALHAEFRFGVRLFREPDAGNPPVRFDEREEETEPSQTGMRRRGKSPANRHREATVTAPLLDSTHRFYGSVGNAGSGNCVRRFCVSTLIRSALAMTRTSVLCRPLSRKID